MRVPHDPGVGASIQRPNRLAEASAALEKAIERNPQFRACSNLGVVLQLEGKFPEAARTYQKSIELHFQLNRNTPG